MLSASPGEEERRQTQENQCTILHKCIRNRQTHIVKWISGIWVKRNSGLLRWICDAWIRAYRVIQRFPEINFTNLATEFIFNLSSYCKKNAVKLCGNQFKYNGPPINPAGDYYSTQIGQFRENFVSLIRLLGNQALWELHYSNLLVGEVQRYQI